MSVGQSVIQSVSQSVSQCVQAFRSIAPDRRPAMVPKVAPKRRNDDGVGHVAPRATCRRVDPSKNFLTRLQPNGGWPGAQTFRPEGPLSDLSGMGSNGPEGAKVPPQGALLHFNLLPSSSDTLGPRVPKFGTQVHLDTRYPPQKIV